MGSLYLDLAFAMMLRDIHRYASYAIANMNGVVRIVCY